MQVVRDCFLAADSANSQDDPLQLYDRIKPRLQRCCMLDESEPGFDMDEHRPGVMPIQSAGSLKRKSVSQSQIEPDLVPSSPPFKAARQWAKEKGTQALERTKSLSKSSPMKSPDLSLSRMPSNRSQHSLRKSISESLHIMSPRLEETESLEWEERGPLEESGKFNYAFNPAPHVLHAFQKISSFIAHLEVSETL
jgi:hypothetical protein